MSEERYKGSQVSDAGVVGYMGNEELGRQFETYYRGLDESSEFREYLAQVGEAGNDSESRLERLRNFLRDRFGL